MDDSISIQIINNIHKELSASTNILFNKSKISCKTRRDRNIFKYANYQTYKDNSSHKKETINGKKNKAFIKSRNNNNYNTNILNNNIKFSDKYFENSDNKNFYKNNYTVKEKYSCKCKEDINNKTFSNIKYIFENYNFKNNSIISKQYNTFKNISVPKNNNLNLNNKKDNSSRIIINSNIKKNLKINKDINKNVNNNISKLLKSKRNGPKIINNERNNKIQSSKASTSMSSFNTFNIIKEKNNNKVVNNSKNNKITKNKNNFIFKNNSSLNIQKKYDNNPKMEILKITPYITENKKENLLSKIAIDSVGGLGDLDIKNDNQDSIFFLTNNPFIPIVNNKINNFNLFTIGKRNLNYKNKVTSMKNSYSILGICDGHGEQGRTISNYISSIIPNKINNYLKSFTNKYYKDNVETEIEPNIKSIFNSINEKLSSMQSLDISYSGSCFCSLIINSSSIISINLGNSLAIVGIQKMEGEKKIFYPYNLTFEHTPLMEKERERIIEKGGEIFKEKDEFGREFGPLKIWRKNDSFHGLMTTRGIGDKEANIIGLISEPEIQYFQIKDEYKFVVVGSYGFWNFINTSECVEIIGKYYLEKDINRAINEIMELSKSRWMDDRGEIMEDISVIIGFLEEND